MAYLLACYIQVFYHVNLLSKILAEICSRFDPHCRLCCTGVLCTVHYLFQWVDETITPHIKEKIGLQCFCFSNRGLWRTESLGKKPINNNYYNHRYGKVIFYSNSKSGRPVPKPEHILTRVQFKCIKL